MLGSQRVFQNISLPLKNARLTPASRAATNVRALPGRPVLVVAARHEDLVVEQQRACAVDVGLARVADVVAVLLEEPDHRVLRPPDLRLLLPVRIVGRNLERAVVGDLEGTLVAAGVARWAERVAPVQAVAPVGVVRLPGRIRGLHEHVGVARVVAHDELDLARRLWCRHGRDGRCRRRTPRCSAPSTTPTPPSCRSRSVRSRSRSGRSAGSAAAVADGLMPAAMIRAPLPW